MTLPDAPRRPKLPLWATVAQSYRLAGQHRGALWHMAWPWLLITAAVMGAFYWWDWAASQALLEQETLAFRWQDGFIALVPVLLAAPLAVGCHRLVLKGETPAPGLYLRLDGLVARYALWLGGLTLFSAASFLPFSLIPDDVEDNETREALLGMAVLGSLALVIVAVLIYTRLSLILPARALEHVHVTAGGIWRGTGGNVLRLLVGGLLAVLPPMLLGIPMLYGIEAGTGRWDSVIANLVFDLLFVLGGVIGVIFLSLAYRHLFGPSAPASGP